MKKLTTTLLAAALLALLALLALGIAETAEAQDAESPGEIYPAAIFPFSERGSGVQDMGGQISDLLFAGLVANPNLWLVEREEMEKMLKEAELNLSGAVDPNQAIQIGKLTGAKIIITGSVFKIKNKTFIVAKVIGTETSRVLGKSVNGTSSIDDLAETLSAQVSEIISDDADKLIAKVRSKEDILGAIKKSVADKKKPKVHIDISEEHVGQQTIDPAAETEMMLVCKEAGFEVTENENDADILIKGEGFSEFATRRGNLISIRSRVEIKAIDQEGNVVAVDRQMNVEVGLAEQATGKKALQGAALKIAERMIPKLVE